MGLLDEAIREHLELKRRRGADPTEVERLEHEALGPVRRGPRDPAELATDHPAEVAIDDRAGVKMDESESESPVTYPAEEMEHEWVESGDGEGLFDYQSEDPDRVYELEEPERAYGAEDEASRHRELADQPEDEAPGHRELAEEPEREAPRHHEIAEEWDAHEPLDFQAPPEPARASEPLDDEPLTDEHPSAAAAPPSRDATAPHGGPPPDGAPPPSAGRPAAPPPSDHDHIGEPTVEYDVEAEHRQEREGDDVLEETPEFLQDTPDHDRLWFEQKPPRDFDLDG